MELTTETKLEEIAIKIDAHGKAAIENILTVGKLLCEAKDIHTSDNAFGEWRANRLPWIKKDSSVRWMNAYKNGGSDLVSHFAKPSVIYELTAPSVPESAREEAEEHESLTVKQAKEIAEANKRIAALRIECAQLKTPPNPDINRLIPELRKLHKGGTITESRALELSTLPTDKQDVYLQEFHSKEFYRKEAERAKEERAKALQDAMDAVKAKEEALAKLKDASGTTEAELMLKHEADLKKAREEYLEQLHKEKQRLSKEASELHERLNKEKIDKAYEDKEKAEKAKKEAQEKASAAYRKRKELEGEINRLKDQLEVNNPDNVDRAMEKQVRSSSTTLMFVLKELRHEMLSMGGGMERSISAVEDVLKDVSLKLDEIKGDVGEIITIEQ